MNRREWLEWRQGGIGGSDIAAIMGRHRWRTEWDVWLSKTQPITAEDLSTTSVVMQTGNRLESAIVDFASEKLGVHIGAGGTYTTRPVVGTFLHMRATPDGRFRLAPNVEHLGFEAKVAEYPWAEVPDYYEDQCQWYMGVTGWRRWLLAAFFRMAPDWRLYWIDYDLDRINEMIDVACSWWQRRIIDGIPPELDETASCSRGLALLHPRPEDDGGREGALAVATEAEISLARDYAHTDKACKDLDAEKRRLGNQLKSAIGDRPGIRWTGGRVRWSSRLTYRFDV